MVKIPFKLRLLYLANTRCNGRQTFIQGIQQLGDILCFNVTRVNYILYALPWS